MELAYNGLHQLCAPLLERLERLPPPQRTALATAFGLSDGTAADRFVVGLATLTLFADVAEQERLVCIVDDAEWLDQVSVQILAFVARRLFAERVAIVCAARTGIGDEILPGSPSCPSEGWATAMRCAPARELARSVGCRRQPTDRRRDIDVIADGLVGVELGDHDPVSVWIEQVGQSDHHDVVVVDERHAQRPGWSLHLIDRIHPCGGADRPKRWLRGCC